MYTIKQSVSLPIRNFDMDTSEEGAILRHGPLFPKTVRGIICGPSGVGKTNIMFSLLCEPNGLKFANVYVYSKTLYQPKYKALEKAMRQVQGMNYFQFKDSDDVIDPSNAREHSIIIFDDVACDKQDKIKEYFAMGRHRSVDSFYLCQTYARIPKHLIRDNSNIIILFKQDEMNLKHVYDDHVTTDMTFTTFKELCTKCWQDSSHGVLVIVKENELNNGRYRKGFDEFICLEPEGTALSQRQDGQDEGTEKDRKAKDSKQAN